MWGPCPTQNLDTIGSSLLTFIGLKQANKQKHIQTDRQAKYTYIYICIEEIELILVKKYHIDEKAMYG